MKKQNINCAENMNRKRRVLNITIDRMWCMVTQLKFQNQWQNYSTRVGQAIRVNDKVYGWKRFFPRAFTKVSTNFLRLFGFFFGFSFFSCSCLFVAVATFYWACFQFKNFRESIVLMGNSEHGMKREILLRVFTLVSKRFCIYFKLKQGRQGWSFYLYYKHRPSINLITLHSS